MFNGVIRGFSSLGCLFAEAVILSPRLTAHSLSTRCSRIWSRQGYRALGDATCSVTLHGLKMDTNKPGQSKAIPVNLATEQRGINFCPFSLGAARELGSFWELGSRAREERSSKPTPEQGGDDGGESRWLSVCSFYVMGPHPKNKFPFFAKASPC